MLDVIAGYLFSLVLGLGSLGLAVYLVVTGQIVDSLDSLFLVMFAGLMAVVSLGYVAWRVGWGIQEESKGK